MVKLFIASVQKPGGTLRPLVTVRAAGEGEAKLFLEAQYPEGIIEAVTEPSDWVSNADTGTKLDDVREHPGVEWQAPSSLAD